MNSNLEEIIETPMDDSTIKEYLPTAKIITNKDLLKYKKIEDIFDKKKPIDFVIYLQMDKPNAGHWLVLNKIGDTIEFFDSYGKPPHEVYNYPSEEQRIKLGTNHDYLSELLNKYKGKVVYNPIQYQEDLNDINTCGRHCCYRVMTLFGKGFSLPKYYNWMKYAKNYLKSNNYDEVVAKLINL